MKGTELPIITLFGNSPAQSQFEVDFVFGRKLSYVFSVFSALGQLEINQMVSILAIKPGRAAEMGESTMIHNPPTRPPVSIPTRAAFLVSFLK